MYTDRAMWLTRVVATLLVVTCAGSAHAGFAFSTVDQVTAWKHFAEGCTAICTGVLSEAESRGPDGSAAQYWENYPFHVDGLLKGKVPERIVIQHPIQDGSMGYSGSGATPLVPGARYLMILQAGTAPPMDTGDIPAYQVWNDHYFLAPTQPGGAVADEKPWETLTRELAATVACDDSFIAFDGIRMTASVLRTISPDLEKGLRQWASQEDWPLGLFARTLLASYGDTELRHTLLRRWLVDKDLPPDTVAPEDWLHSMSTPPAHLRNELGYLMLPMATEPASRELIVQLALDRSVEEGMRLDALCSLDNLGVDPRVLENACRTLLLRPDDSRKLLGAAVSKSARIYSKAGKELSQAEYNPNPQDYEADPEPYLARWRKLLSPKP